MTILVSNDEWLNELRTRLPGISEGQLSLELKSTLREFFTKSGFWMEELDPINIVADKELYKLSYPQARVMVVHRVWIDNAPTTLSTIAPKANSGRKAYMKEPDLLQIGPMPTVSVDDGLVVQAQLNPLPCMDKVPYETVTHFFNEVLDGVLGRLYSQPGKPYTNLIQSQYHLKRFRDGMALARDMGRKRFSNSTRPWVYPQGWA